MSAITAVNNTVQYSTVQYSIVQYSTVQYSIVQYSTVQYSTSQEIDNALDPVLVLEDGAQAVEGELEEIECELDVVEDDNLISIDHVQVIEEENAIAQSFYGSGGSGLRGGSCYYDGGGYNGGGSCYYGSGLRPCV
jgi:hypothetical protein